jgi:pilus assembly protein Flp/PilA
MKDLKNFLLNEESGQGMVEYGLIIALIAVVAMGAFGILGGKVRDKMTNVTSEMDKVPAKSK